MKSQEQEKEYEQDEWKIALRSEILAAMTGTPDEKEHAYAEVGYYYKCYAPASLYKYYPDSELYWNSVKMIKCGILHHVILMMCSIVTFQLVPRRYLMSP